MSKIKLFILFMIMMTILSCSSNMVKHRVRITYFYKGKPGMETTLLFDASGNLVKEIETNENAPNIISSPFSLQEKVKYRKVKSYSYDQRGNSKEINYELKDLLGNTIEKFWQTHEYKYDPITGKVVREKQKIEIDSLVLISISTYQYNSKKADYTVNTKFSGDYLDDNHTYLSEKTYDANDRIIMEIRGEVSNDTIKEQQRFKYSYTDSSTIERRMYYNGDSLINYSQNETIRKIVANELKEIYLKGDYNKISFDYDSYKLIQQINYNFIDAEDYRIEVSLESDRELLTKKLTHVINKAIFSQVINTVNNTTSTKYSLDFH